VLSPAQVAAQQSTASSGGLSSAEISRIVTAFTAKEAEFRQALNKYSFKRDALVQSLGMGGQITGEFRRVSIFLFDEQGNRNEKVNFAPFATFGGVTPEDLDDLGGVNPFALEPSKIDRYNFKYVGKEKIDELDLYVFDVTPKVIPDPKTKERLFTGRVWVEDHDLQIVKSRGKGVPETKINKFPNVETYREEIDGRYWFPTYSFADEELIFDSGEVLHIKMKVRYSDFVLPHTKVIITEADDQTPTPAPSAGVPMPQRPNTPQQIDRQQPIESGVLNGKAIELPEPKLPAGAPKLSGKVTVRVVIDETGKVISAEVEDGRIELRLPALEAARKARFSPTLLGGQRVKVTGILTYRFYQ
jgi:TonB family protein